ncbi:hypothetical protein [Paenibacillus sp. LjRoot153]
MQTALFYNIGIYTQGGESRMLLDEKIVYQNEEEGSEDNGEEGN